jgi:hypothetical protein
MKKVLFYSLLPAIFGLFFTIQGCNKDDSSNTPNNYKSFTVNASSSSVWKYFSFNKNDTVVVSNPDSSLEWDLAFQRYRIRTNGGKSGTGQGGAYRSGNTNQGGFDSLNIVPDGISFGLDDTVSVNVAPGQYVKYVMNTVLQDWYNLVNGGQTLISKDEIFIIRTADGKYAKIWLQNYYNELAKSGYPKFQYFYQADGTKNLK